MRRRLLYHETAVEPAPTIWGYEIVIDEFYYKEAGPHDVALSPIYRYHYHPVYNDNSKGDDVYITQNDENPDFLNIEFSIDDSSAAAVADAGTKVDKNNGNLTFNAWEEIQTTDSDRLLATVNMEVWYVAPNEATRGRDERSTDATQVAIQIKWQIPQVELYYDDAPAQPEEEGGEIVLKPTVKWTQIGYDDDGILHTETSEQKGNAQNAQYVFSCTGDISIDVDGNVTVPSSTVESRHNVGTVTVGVTNEYVSESEQTGYANCDIYQEAYEEPQPQEETSFPMDILMLNNKTHKQEIMGCDEHTTKDFPNGTYTPIGIVLTPVYRGSREDDTNWVGENRYSGYGEDVGVMGVIALTDASLTSLEEGTTNPSEILCGSSDAYNERMYVAEEEKNNRMLVSISCLPRIDDNGKPTEDITGWAEDADGAPNYDKNIASAATDKSATMISPLDIWSGYASESGNKTPSPYFVSEDYKERVIEDGEKGDFEGYNYKVYKAYEDPGFYGNMNALADYNGELNSLEILLGKSFGIGREWIENTTSNSNTQRTDCPAVEACWKYAPEGTAQGGWYLPALGELSLMAARFKKINETLEQLNAFYGVEVSPLKDTEVPYLSSTHFISQINDETTQREVETKTLFALVPKAGEAKDMGYNRVCTSTIGGVTRYGGYVRPFKKIRNEIPYGNTANAYNYTPHYELMPAHYTQTFCDGVSGREWFGQKFIVSFRRGCMSVGKDLLGEYNYIFTSGYLRLYGYRVKGENDATIVDETPRMLAEVWVKDLDYTNSDTWPTYSGDEKGVNIVGRFTTTPVFDTDGAFDRDTDAYLDMDTDEFDRDGTVEPGWYIIAGVAIYGRSPSDAYGSDNWHILPNTGNYNVAVVKDEIDIVNGVESKEAFFDEIRTTPYVNYSTNTVTEYPFYVGQLDRPVAFLFASYGVSNDD